MAIPRADAELNAYLASLPPEYRPNWMFAYDQEDGHNQLYAIPASQYTKDRWGQGSYFAEDPDNPITAQALYTGQVPGAVPLDPNALPEEYKQDYDIWQNRLMYGQMKKDSWSPWGDQLFGALMGLGLATGGAALAGGFAAPLAEGALAAGELGLETTFPMASTVPDIAALGSGGSSLAAPIGYLAPTLPATGGVSPALAGGAGAGAAGAGAALPATSAAAAGGGGVLGLLGELAPILGPLISGGTSILGGVLGGNAARDAAETQAGAAGDANKLLMDIFNQQRADLLPYMGAGYASLAQLAGMADQPFTYGDYAATPVAGAGLGYDPSLLAFRAPNTPTSAAQHRFAPPSGQQVLNEDPGYAFRVAEGMKALESGAAARGGLLSGGMVKGAQRFGQELASQEYGNAYNRALGRNVLDYDRSRYENEEQYRRALTENQLYNERTRADEALQYGRNYQQNADIAARNLGQYQTNLATQTGLRNLRFNELAALAGLGRGATDAQVNLASNLGNQMAGNITGAGAATAAGQVGASNALLQGLTGVGNAANSYLNYQLLQNLLAGRR